MLPHTRMVQFGITIFLLVSMAWSLHFPNKRQAEFIKQLKDYELVVPYRVNSKGNYESHHLHPDSHVVKRSAGEFPDENENPDSVHYHVTVENETLHIELVPNHDFIAPAMVVERRKSRFKNTSDSSFTRYQKKNCHYIGNVKDDLHSKVAIGTCNGLTGILQTKTSEYFIDPVKDHPIEADGKHPHIVYKRSALPQHMDIYQNSGTFKQKGMDGCPLKDTEKANKKREIYERHRQRGMPKTVEYWRRKKRSVSSPKYVETLVVVDPVMMNYYYNEDMETYVLTVMNIVSALFHDASIGNAINIKVVRLMLLEEHQDELIITHHADKSLRSFCRWQRKINFKDDNHPNHHDVAILMTRHDICSRINRPCNTLGLAHVTGMCQPQFSCNINEDSGLALAYTVAHELGHNFGMHHDNTNTECMTPEDRTYVMAPQMFGSSHPKIWSACSKKAVTKFLDRNWGYCLNDEPKDSSYVFPILPPGTMYDADHQCRLQYGPKAKLCESFDNMCSYLWCHVNKTCTTKRESAAEGTICGSNKWCFKGECVLIGDRPEAIDGQWGEWAEWTTCTRTCGGGVSTSQRLCDNPPPSNGGKYCIGERKRYRICETKECAHDAPTFREKQCSSFNNETYKGELRKWTPVQIKSAPCQLHCKPSNEAVSVLKKDMAIDGTPCHLHGRDLCISGRCQHVGCDWVLNSNAQEDRCGVCHGDGSTCMTIKDQFNETKGSGYQEAKIIPTGARNIMVAEVESAENNYLALRNNKGEYYLNGNWYIQWSGDYQIAGTTVHYARKGNVESFNAPGPLKEPLTIMLLLQSKNAGIEFEYTVPTENATQRIPEFSWQYTDWSHCTSSCGVGTQRSVIICTEMEAGRVDDSYCNATTKPDDKQRTCNEHLCPSMWWKGRWQHCSVTCGSGIQRRTVMCVRSLGDEEQIALDDSACASLKRPVSEKTCHQTDVLCPKISRWISSPWDDTCNQNPCGWKKRQVVCEDPILGCKNATKLVSKIRCSNITCGNWTVGEWSVCTRSCGGGVQYRRVACIGSKHCDLEVEPSSEESCNLQACTTQAPSTTTSTPASSTTTITKIMTRIPTTIPTTKTTLVTTIKTTPVTTTTATTTMTTTATTTTLTTATTQRSTTVSRTTPTLPLPTNSSVSKDARQNKNQVEKNHSSDVSGKYNGQFLFDKRHRKNSQRKKTRADDKFSHRHINKTNKSGKGKGVSHQNTTEHKPVATSMSQENVAGNQKLSKKNKTMPVRFQWTSRNWTQCEIINPYQSCGDGNQSRVVYCMDSFSPHKSPVHSIWCNFSVKPPERKKCKIPCLKWMTSSWSSCSASCAYGFQRRKVKCPRSRQCDLSKRPSETQRCHEKPCPSKWVTGAWSKCTKTCGTGDQIRLVQCVDISTRQPTNRCKKAEKPIIRKKCQTQHCPRIKKKSTFKCGKPENENLTLCRKLRARNRCKHIFVNQICCNTCKDIRVVSRRAYRIRS